MATAVSGTGPTYVFLVMEALIDAAVHLGFPRHIAHDLVIETLEGSTVFAKQSGMHPAELRNMVTSPGGTSAAALHELESGRLRTVLSEAVWAAYRRTVELGDQLEASVVPDRRPADRRPVTTLDADVPRRRDRGLPATCAGCRWPRSASRDLRHPDRDLWADEAALWDRMTDVVGRARRRGLARPGCRAVRRGRPGLVAGRARRAHRRLAGARDGVHGPCPRDRGVALRRRLRRRLRPFNERRREPWASLPRDAILARLEAARPRLLELAHAPVRGDDPQRPRLGLGLHDAPRPLPRPSRGHRAVDRRAAVAPTGRRCDGPRATAEPATDR